MCCRNFLTTKWFQ